MSQPARTHKLLSAEEFAQLSFEGKAELVDGVVVQSEEMPGAKHSGSAAEIITELNIWARQTRIVRVLPECGYVVARDPDRVRRPDVSVVRRERLPDLPAGYLDLVPDLAVEIVSPNDKAEELADKLEDYRRVGVPLVWVVYPHSRMIVAHTLDKLARIHVGEDVIAGGDVLPGFECPIARFFP
jgi:Uma2 family endonuclease